MNQRIKTANKTKRMTACTDWSSKMDDGWQFDPRSVYRADAKIFRIGEVGGRPKNYRVLISNDKRKYEMNAEELQRADGAWMGGASVHVFLGVCYYGVGRPYMLPKGQMLTADYYCSISQSHCAIEVAEFFGPAGAQDFVYMQDGASAHRSNRAQALCGELFPSFITKA